MEKLHKDVKNKLRDHNNTVDEESAQRQAVYKATIEMFNNVQAEIKKDLLSEQQARE